ncbi:MAG: glycosyltransferase [Helicobacteraceae bacterium]|nr:glycosyltransferase [Helicobacteraceae bacterium]
MKQKKIIFTHLLNDYSGSPKVLSQVIKAVQKNGSEVELYTGKSDDGFLSGLTDRHHHYFYKRFENKYLTLVTFMLSQVSLFFKLLKYRNEDVIIYVNTMLPFGAGLAGKFMGKPVYYHVHETSLTPASFKRFLRTIVQKTASKVIFVSKSVEEAEAFVNIPQEVIYNALPNDFANIALKSTYMPLRDEKFNVLMICSLKAYKGIEEFVSITELCETQKNITFTLVLNAEQTEIDSYYKGRTLPSNMILVARQNDLVPYYQKASLLLNLSRVDEWVETFGLTIIEAMAFGIPVIVPPVGGPVEIVHDGKEGYLISSYETEKIAKVIVELSKDEEKCMGLSKAARKRVEGFREDVFEKKIIEVICE